MNYFLATNLVIELAFLIVAFFLFNKRHGVWRGFIVIYFLILAIDQLGWKFLINKAGIMGSIWPWNFLLITSTSFYILFLATSPIFKKWVKIGYALAIVFGLFCLWNLIFFQGFLIYNTYSETVGDIIIAIMCCYSLFTLVHNEEYVRLDRSEYFWMASGLLIYAFGNAAQSLFAFALYEFFLKTNISLVVYLHLVLEIILLIIFTIAVICRRRNTRLLPVS